VDAVPVVVTATLKRTAAVCFGVVAAVLVAAGPEPPRDAPTLDPDRIVLTPTADPTTSQAVTWRTSENAVAAEAEIRGPGEGQATLVIAESSDRFVAEGFRSRLHTVVFDGLSPGTTYTYRVGDGTHWSDWSRFTTAADLPEPFTFIYVGDAQRGLDDEWARLVEQAVGDEPDARVWLHAGDLVNDAGSDAQWGAWFDAAEPVTTTALTVAAAGNHDHDEPDRLSRHWQPQFAFPANGPSSDGVLAETVYYVDYQGVRFVVLNSNVALETQADWLDRVLATNQLRWSVVVYHHPVFSTAEDRDNPEVRDAWLPVLEEHDVDLVLQGHDHTYGRGQSSDDGPVFVVAVAGSKMYDLGDPEDAWRAHGAELQHSAENLQTYQVVEVDGDTLRYESRTLSGDVQDAFTIVDSDDGKQVVDDR
jgi:Purple acid Phosphatase, N-terminal domain/Calcineurin-like phosphoesterase